MRDDFCCFILTHGRPDRVYTYDTLIGAGYDGPVFIVIDDEDDSAEEYRKRFGDKVVQFSKAEIAKTFDEADNFDDRRSIVYARNFCHQLAKTLGFRYYIQLDDDYKAFRFKSDKNLNVVSYIPIRKTISETFSALVDFVEETPVKTICLSQGGDHIGGITGHKTMAKARRKAMNSFVASVDKPLKFIGRVNEDVNTYTRKGSLGEIYLTTMQAQLDQKQTQSNAGGMTDLYLDSGTYVKSFYSVIFSPSSVKVGMMGDHRVKVYRLHHVIDWTRTVPQILREDWRK